MKKSNTTRSKLGRIHRGNLRLEHHISAWMSMAYELRRTEELIYMDILRDWEERRVDRATGNFKAHGMVPDKVYFLAIGLAVENLLKCIFLNGHPEIITKGKIENKSFKSHDLVMIARDVLKLRLNEDENFLCELGTKAIYWTGRYPIPLKETETFIGIETNKSEIHNDFHKLFERLTIITRCRPEKY